MSRLRRATAKAKDLDRVFDDPKSEMQAQILRLCVLYEDFRIESTALVQETLSPLDHAGLIFRQLYFLRRAATTLHEMSGAIHKLNMDREFKAHRRSLDKDRRRQWDSATKAIQVIHSALGAQRNLYGGHFLDKAARFALGHLSGSHGLIVVDFNTLAHTYNVVFKFAGNLTAIALTAEHGDADIATYSRESIRRIIEAGTHVTTAVHVLTETFLFPRFGLPG